MSSVRGAGLRADNRLADAPMVPVNCRRCGARVLARKSSWEQTSVQWDAMGSARCEQRNEARLLSDHVVPQVFLGCTEVTESILAATLRGDVPVIDDI